jgi:bifunctional oligoribonuclease and PAP phosphatase NrnA
MNLKLEEIVQILKSKSTIVIVGHTNPDSDAVNSSFALAYALKNMGKNVKVVLEEYNPKYNISKGYKFLYKGDISKLCFDLIVSVDTGSIERLGSMKDIYADAKESICIDHHVSNDYFGKYNYVIKDASSTSEIIYEIVKELVDVDANIGTCIYGGILTDTGGFRYESTSPKTLSIVSKLLELDINFTKIYNDLMVSKTIEEMKIYCKAVEKITFSNNEKISYTNLTKEDFDDCNANTQHLDGVVEFLLSVDTVEVGVLIYQKAANVVKVSMRSKALDVNKIANSFGGGGHKLASGCILNNTIEEATKTILKAIERELS